MAWHKKMKPMIAYADIGSHGKIFEFIAGPVGDRYPHLLNVYAKKVMPGLVKVCITPVVRKKPKRKAKPKEAPPLVDYRWGKRPY